MEERTKNAVIAFAPIVLISLFVLLVFSGFQWVAVGFKFCPDCGYEIIKNLTANNT